MPFDLVPFVILPLHRSSYIYRVVHQSNKAHSAVEPSEGVRTLEGPLAHMMTVTLLTTLLICIGWIFWHLATMPAQQNTPCPQGVSCSDQPNGPSSN